MNIFIKKKGKECTNGTYNGCVATKPKVHDVDEAFARALAVLLGELKQNDVALARIELAMEILGDFDVALFLAVPVFDDCAPAVVLEVKQGCFARQFIRFNHLLDKDLFHLAGIFVRRNNVNTLKTIRDVFIHRTAASVIDPELFILSLHVALLLDGEGTVGFLPVGKLFSEDGALVQRLFDGEGDKVGTALFLLECLEKKKIL